MITYWHKGAVNILSLAASQHLPCFFRSFKSILFREGSLLFGNRAGVFKHRVLFIKAGSKYAGIGLIL